MTTKITRACELSGVDYSVGDTVTEAHLAEKLVTLGFAKSTKSDETPAVKAAQPAATTAKKET